MNKATVGYFTAYLLFFFSPMAKGGEECPMSYETKMYFDQSQALSAQYNAFLQYGFADRALAILPRYQEAERLYIRSFYRQEESFFKLSGNPRCLMSVHAMFAGFQLVLYQYTDGTYGLGNKEEPYHTGLSRSQVIQLLREAPGL